MSNDQTLTDELLNKTISFSPAPGMPAARTGTIGETLADVDRLIAVRDPAKAVHLLLQLNREAPASVHIKMLLARLYCEHGRHRQALPLLDEVLAVEAKHLPAFIAKGHALFHLNRARDAVAIAETVRTIEPADPDNLNSLGVYRMAVGDFDAASEAYSAAISLRPDFVAAYHNLLRLPDQTLDDQQRENLSRLSSDRNLPDRDRALAMLCISRHYRWQDDIRREFEYLNRAKSILARLSPWDATESAQLVREITALEPPMLEPFERSRRTRVTPIFISSMPRAGSTLIEQLIAAHPDVSSIGEAGLATLAARAALAEHGLEDLHWWRWLELPNATSLLATIRLAFDRAIAGFIPTTRFVCEKSINNDIMLGLCLLAFPEAFVIHCKRDPLDICLSAYQAYFPQLNYSNRLDWLADRYRQHVKLMEHWHGLFPGRIAEVRYEDLVSRPDEEVARILDAIGLERPVEGLRLDDRNYTVNNASNWQVRQPIYQTSQHRWRQYRQQLQEIMHLQEEQPYD
jgi:Flp pilus assembly protein TadD